MAHSLSAKKRVRQNLKHRARNRWRLRTMREALKKFDDKIVHSSVEEAREAYLEACKILDKTASKGVIHKNQAARRKSRLNARLKAKATA
ncbi:MAG: 30S ribosomal protein S20 [Phycisphaerales bacterium]|nr:30S ribosomal protein S20 [bacterium]